MALRRVNSRTMEMMQVLSLSALAFRCLPTLPPPEANVTNRRIAYKKPSPKIDATRIFCFLRKANPLIAGIGVAKTAKSVTIFMMEVRYHTANASTHLPSLEGIKTATGTQDMPTRTSCVMPQAARNAINQRHTSRVRPEKMRRYWRRKEILVTIWERL